MQNGEGFNTATVDQSGTEATNYSNILQDGGAGSTADVGQTSVMVHENTSYIKQAGAGVSHAGVNQH